jgi:hypothetical protein
MARLRRARRSPQIRSQRFLYVGNRSQAKVMVFDRKSMKLLDSFGRGAPRQASSVRSTTWRPIRKGIFTVTEVTPLSPKNSGPKFNFLGLAAK